MSPSTRLLRFRSVAGLSRALRQPVEKLRRLAASSRNLYRHFDVLAPGKLKWRHIDDPYIELKEVQRSVAMEVLHPVELPPTLMGGVPGCSLMDHVQPHVCSRWVVTFDVENCFPSIKPVRVFGALCKFAGCAPEVAQLLTQLTTLGGSLPQGAPTSTPLANLCMIPFHRAVAREAGRRSLAYTQWVDDLVLSGEEAPDAISMVYGLASRYRWRLGSGKTKVMGSHERQIISNVVVNKSATVPRERRSALYEAMCAALETGEVSASEWRSLLGKVAYVAQLNPRQADALKAFALHVENALVLVEGPKKRRDQVRPCKLGCGRWPAHVPASRNVNKVERVQSPIAFGR